MKQNKCTWLDGELGKLIKYQNRKNKGKVDWEGNVGQSLMCIDRDGIEHVVTIQSKIPKTSHIIIASEGNELNIFVGSFINCQLNSLFKIITKDFKKSKGDIVGDFLIINTKKVKDKNRKEWKTYTVKCLKCKTIKDVREYTLLNNKCVCDFCSDGISFAEKFIMGVLKQLNIKYDRQVKFDWCTYNNYKEKGFISYGIYDFVLDNNYITIGEAKHKIIIETDGGFHNKDNKMSGQTKEESKYIDDEKDRLANEHGYKVIRIDCDYPTIEQRFEYIKSSFVNNGYIQAIIKLFGKIDWNLVYDSACTSLKLKCWDLKNNNQNLFICEIANILGISETTTNDYLKEGNKYGKCKYDSEKQNKMRIEKVAYVNSRPIEVFKNNESQGIFINASECSRKSLKEYGIKLSNSHIRSVCRGERKSHMGYTFKEISKEEYEERTK